MRVVSTEGAGDGAVKMVVAGEAGNGKTTLARTLAEGLTDERVLIVSAEAGLLSLRGSKIDVADIQTADDGKPVEKAMRFHRLGEVFAWLQQPDQQKKYRWIFVDSLTEINQNVLEMLEADPAFQGQANTIKKYGELSVRMRGLCKSFRDLAHYNVIFTALVKSETDADGKPVMKIDMVGAFAEKLPALFDEIFYLGVLPEVDERTGKNKRALLTQKTDRISFPKDRSGKLDRIEPADLAYAIRKIRGQKVGEKPLLSDISQMGKAAAAQAKEQGSQRPAPLPASPGGA